MSYLGQISRAANNQNLWEVTVPPGAPVTVKATSSFVNSALEIRKNLVSWTTVFQLVLK